MFCLVLMGSVFVPAGRPVGSVSFPIDFFEHCQQSNDVEVGTLSSNLALLALWQALWPCCNLVASCCCTPTLKRVGGGGPVFKFILWYMTVHIYSCTLMKLARYLMVS